MSAIAKRASSDTRATMRAYGAALAIGTFSPARAAAARTAGTNADASPFDARTTNGIVVNDGYGP